MVTGSRLPPPEDLQAELERSCAVGLLLYLHDKASAIGADVMRANVSPRELGISGYLTFQDGDDQGRPLNRWRVTFYRGGDQPHVVCTVVIPTQAGATPVFTLSEPPAPVSDDMRGMIRVRETAMAALRPFSQPQNPVILPPPKDGPAGWLVYLLAGTTRNRVAVLGKHHRVLVSPDGEHVLNIEPLSKSAIEVPLDTPDGGPAAGLYVTHLVTACPLETHVFASLLHKTPISVGTSRGSWLVSGTEISLLALRPETSPPATPPPSPATPSPATPPPAAPNLPRAPAARTSDAPTITPSPRFEATLSRKPWWRFW